LSCACNAAAQPASAPVTVSEDQSTYTVANGIVVARVSKKTGDLVSLRYQGMEVLDESPEPMGEPPEIPFTETSARLPPSTPFSIAFDLGKAPLGKATLRLAICGGNAPYVDVTVNQQPAGRIDRLAGDPTIARNGISGIWYERELPFDASLMKAGANVMQLIVPAGPVTSGILYDYLRLELEER